MSAEFMLNNKKAKTHKGGGCWDILKCPYDSGKLLLSCNDGWNLKLKKKKAQKKFVKFD